MKLENPLQEYARTGTKESFERFRRRYCGWIQRFARAQAKNFHDAAEVAQEFYVSILQTLPSHKDAAYPLRFLKWKMRKIAHSMRRASDRRVKREAKASETRKFQSDQNAAVNVEHSELRQRLATLPPKSAAIAWVNTGLGASSRDTGRILSLDPRNVKSHITKLLISLQCKLHNHGSQSTFNLESDVAFESRPLVKAILLSPTKPQMEIASYLSRLRMKDESLKLHRHEIYTAAPCIHDTFHFIDHMIDHDDYRLLLKHLAGNLWLWSEDLFRQVVLSRANELPGERRSNARLPLTDENKQYIDDLRKVALPRYRDNFLAVECLGLVLAATDQPGNPNNALKEAYSQATMSISDVTDMYLPFHTRDYYRFDCRNNVRVYHELLNVRVPRLFDSRYAKNPMYRVIEAMRAKELSRRLGGTSYDDSIEDLVREGQKLFGRHGG